MLAWSVFQACEALVPVAIGVTIDQAIAPSNDRAMWLCAIALAALFLVLTFGWRLGYVTITAAMARESHEQRLELIGRLLNRHRASAGRAPGELLSIATSDVRSVSSVLELTGRLLSLSIGLLVAVSMLIRIDWALGGVLLAGVVTLAGSLRISRNVVERRVATQQQAAGLASATAADLLGGLRTLQGFGGTSAAAQTYVRASRVALRGTLDATRVTAVFAAGTAFGTTLVISGVTLLGGHFALAGRITIGELITMIGLASFLIDPINELADTIFRLSVTAASAVRVAEVRESGSSSKEHPSAHGATAELPIRFVETHLDGSALFSATLDSGNLYGVVTTSEVSAREFVELLDGHAPRHGSVRLGDQDIWSIDPGRLHHQILVEPKVPLLFGASLREAIQTDRVAENHELLAVAHATALHDLLSGQNLEDPFDRRIQERGMNLSGGQRQRVALARALLARRPVLVLQDPTSAVDAATEQRVADGISKLRAEDRSITLVLTSSPALLSVCDRVFFISERGSTAGTHSDLMKSAEYAALVSR